MDADPDGMWRTALRELGATAEHYDDAIRTYTGSVHPAALARLREADFVLAVEPVGAVAAAHDTAVPAVGADALRSWSGAVGAFSGTGGTTVPIGVMDSGLNIAHADIGTHRESICGSSFVNDGDSDLWVDEDAHGTHVAGTMVGNGYLDARYAGVAPSVAHVRVAKVLDRTGVGTVDGILRGMDYLAEATGCEGSELVQPLVVNMSLARSGDAFEGRDVAARKLDATVWASHQLIVVAQGNEGGGGFSDLGSAKNSLAVGASFDGGEVARFSSLGPTADGRLAPRVVAPGVDVCSPAGDGVAAGYNCRSGTSMAAPMVAGVAALLMDAEPGFRSEPALARARLMASAVRLDAWFDDSAAFPLDNSDGPGPVQAQYGLGKVSARTTVLERDEPDGWFGGSTTATLDDAAEYAYEDISVPDGAKRLEVVLTWDEPPAEAILTASVLNDVDLWLDHGGDCGGAACGEHVSASRTDNVEWVTTETGRTAR